MPYASESMQGFTMAELGEDTVPDESTILRLGQLPDAHELTPKSVDNVCALLEDQRLLLKVGTIEHATIIAALSCTENATQTRDPEMNQTKKGNQQTSACRSYVGTDTRGLVHSLTTTPASATDITHLEHLFHWHATGLHGDKAYRKESDRRQLQAGGGRYRVNRCGERTDYRDGVSRARLWVRARCEHVFLVVRRLWRFMKVRFRRLAMNTAHAMTTLALANLCLVRHKLWPHGT